MYAQVTKISVPVGLMKQMRHLIDEEYVPIIRTRPGFVSAVLLEQADDVESAELIVMWEDQAAVENFNRTGMLEASTQGLAARFPGVKLQRQGYLVTVNETADNLAGV